MNIELNLSVKTVRHFLVFMSIKYILELLLNVRSGVQHLCDKLDFVEGTGETVKPGRFRQISIFHSFFSENADVVEDINAIIERSGKQIDSLLQSLGDDVSNTSSFETFKTILRVSKELKNALEQI